MPAFLTIFLFYLNYPKILALLLLFVIAVQMAARRYIAHRQNDFIKKCLWINKNRLKHIRFMLIKNASLCKM